MLCSLFLAAVAPRAQAAPVPGRPQDGVASWHKGGQTASKAPWCGKQLVAAHRTLPFHSQVEVVNLHNGRRVTVRIIDRGPYLRGRVIDLSHAAARELDMVGRGVARVRLLATTVNAEPPAPLDRRAGSR